MPLFTAICFAIQVTGLRISSLTQCVGRRVARWKPDLRRSRQFSTQQLTRRCLYGSGGVFRLKPHANGSWTESVLYTFTGAGCPIL